MGDGSGSPRIFWRLLIIAGAFGLGKSTFEGLWEKFVIIPSTLPPGVSTQFNQALQLADTLGAFLISPVLVFGALYLAGKRINLNESWWPAVLSLFVGGALGGVLTLIPEWLILFGPDLSNLSLILTSIFESPIGLGNFILDAVDGGLFSLFVGVTALFLRARRAKMAAHPAAETTAEVPQS